MEPRKKLLVSVSGGRSSAVLAKLLFDRYQHKYEMVFVFANTSREDERTLEFIRDMQTIWLMPIVMIEAVVHHGVRKSSTHIEVDFDTAHRNGEVFEEVIIKYGIPGKSFPHCTRELKARPIESYARSIGWDKKDYAVAIGYRADEPKRVNLIKAATAKPQQIYHLFEWGIKKPDVAVYFKGQPFDLQLEDWEGNCRLCYKKSKRKILTQIVADPKSVDWVRQMQDEHGYRAPAQYKGELPMRFFRDRQSIEELIEESKEPFNKALDKSMITEGADFDYELDEQEDCSESCEAFPL